MIRQSTAVILKLGPFVDSTDGSTAETGLTIAQGDIQISKNGGAYAQTSDAAPTTTHDADGWYPIPLTTTDTGTLGKIKVQVAMAGALPVWWEDTVVTANVYDSLVASGDLLEVDVLYWYGAAIPGVNSTGVPYVDVGELGGDDQSLTDLKDFADTGYDPATHKVQGVVLTDTTTTNTDMRGTDSAALASVWTEARAGALTDWIDGGRLDLLLDAIPTTPMRGTDSALTTLGANAPAGWINAAAVAASALDGKGNWSTHSAADVYTAFGTGANLSALVTATSVGLNDDAITASKFDESTAFPVKSADTGATQIARVGADGDTLETLSDQIDGITITAASIADAVWDELKSGHAVAGSFGYYLDATISGVGGAVGSGAIEYTVTITDGTDPLDGVECWITTDSAGTNVIAGTVSTNASGEAVFMLDAGTYYLWKQLSGYEFTNPETLTVS